MDDLIKCDTYIHGIFFSFKKEANADIFYNMDNAWRQYASKTTQSLLKYLE